MRGSSVLPIRYQLGFILPSIAPTGKRVEVAVAVVLQFDGDKMAHEHLYWEGLSAGAAWAARARRSARWWEQTARDRKGGAQSEHTSK